MSRPAIDRSPRLAQRGVVITRETPNDRYNVSDSTLKGYATAKSILKLLAPQSGIDHVFYKPELAGRCYHCNRYFRLVPVEGKA